MFKLYPRDLADALSPTPLLVAPQTTSMPQKFTELASAGPAQEMFIRVATNGSVVPPTLSLSAAGGAAVAVNVATTATINDAANNYVAAGFLTQETYGVWLITIVLSVTGSNWTLTIHNNDAVADDPPGGRKYVWAVADNDTETQQPWIHMDPTLSFNLLINKLGTQTVAVYNYGSGPITTLAAAFSDPSFGGTIPPGTTIQPNTVTPATALQFPVTLAASGTPNKFTGKLDISSNDLVAVPSSAGHNSEVTLSGRVGLLELVFLLDASGSMLIVDPPPQGVNPPPPTDSRWNKLASAANSSFDMLTNFASDKGKFAVLVYPDTIGGTFNVPNAGEFTPMTTINPPSVLAAHGALNVKPHGANVNASTPMGAGIAKAIGSTGGAPWGYFSKDDATNDKNYRWLILMTDGNSNYDPPDPVDFEPATMGGPGFVPKFIQVSCIGYGLNTAEAAQPVNTALLTQLVASGLNPAAGNYDWAQADVGPDVVSGFIKSLLSGPLALDSYSDPTGVLTTAAPTVTRQAIVGPYDNKACFLVAWGTADEERLDVSVTTPLGEVITASAAGCVVNPGDRYRMITVDKDFLDNAKAGTPRYGTWTLKISLGRGAIGGRVAASAGVSEVYNYQIITDSRLNLRCTLDKVPYTCGDAVTLSARLTLDGHPITGALVSVAQTSPGAAALNWLANMPVSAAEYAAAAASQSGNPDMDSLGIKLVALAAKGATFQPVANNATASLTDRAGTGTYSVTSGNTAVPGTYTFLVSAVGTLPDGSLFRREQNVTIEVIVRADPAASVVQTTYLPLPGGSYQSTVTVWPKDRFGNVVLIDPKVDPTVRFSSSAGGLIGSIVDNHDGSYSQVVTYPAGSPPIIGITVGGVTVTPGVPLEPVHDLRYVDKVYHYQAGAQGAPNANQHTDPNACLGDFTTKPTPVFVSLGAGGSLIVGFSGHYAVDDAHGEGITVFVASDQPPRPYSVEAHHGDGDDDWFLLGVSSGGTQTFSLHHHHHLPTARAIRIRDSSGVIRAPDGTPSPSPGVSIAAVGARKLERGDGDLDDVIWAWVKKFF